MYSLMYSRHEIIGLSLPSTSLLLKDSQRLFNKTSQFALPVIHKSYIKMLQIPGKLKMKTVVGHLPLKCDLAQYLTGIALNQSWAAASYAFNSSIDSSNSLKVVLVAHFQTKSFNPFPLNFLFMFSNRCLTQNLCSAAGNTFETAWTNP